MNVSVGNIVLSGKGRDKGRLFFVVAMAEDGCVFISDGDYRRISNPKKKKLKHISHFSSAETKVANKLKDGEKVTDAELRKAIRQLENPLFEGG